MKLTNSKFKVIGAFVVCLLSFALYTYSAARTNPGYADSDELITAGYLLGSAHPPGYPLQIVLVKLFTLLPVPGTVAFKANLLAAFLQSLTVVFTYLTGLEILLLLTSRKKLKKEKDEKLANVTILHTVVSAGGALLLALSALFWLYSSVIEVMSLNNFLAALAVWCGFQWKKNYKKTKQKQDIPWFLATCFVVGLGLSHVHTFVLLLPGFAFLLFITIYKKGNCQKEIAERGLYILGAVLLGFLSPNLLLFWLNTRKAKVSWYFPQSLQGWINHISRRVYSGYLVENSSEVSAYLAKFNLSQYVKTFPLYWQFLGSHFVYVGLVLGLVGVVWLARKHRELLMVLGTLYLFPGLLLALYMGMPDKSPVENLEYRSIVGVSQRQMLLGETMWGLLVIVGLWGVVTLLHHFIKNKIVALFLGVSFLVLTLGLSFWQNRTMGVQRNNTIAWDYAKEVLSKAEENSVLICFADFSCFSLFYMQEVEGFRPDVAVLSKNAYLKKNYLEKNPHLKGFDYIDNPYFVADLITWNVSQRTTYLTDTSGFYSKYLGFEGDPFYLVPEGYLYRVTTKLPQEVSDNDYTLTQKLLHLSKSEKDYWINGLQDYFANFHTISGTIFSYLNEKEEARENFRLATELSPDYALAQTLQDSLSGYFGNPNYELGQESSSSAEFLQSGLEKIEQGEIEAAYKDIQKATFLDPLNKDARLKLMELYELGGYYREAVMECRNILKYYPEEPGVVEELKQLENAIKTEIN